MPNFRKTLIKIKDEIKPLLFEVFPDCAEAIEFQYKEDFQEWFSMLFNISDWTMKMVDVDINKIYLNKNNESEARENLESYEGLEDYGIFSLVTIKGRFHMIDGYHRVLIAKKENISHIKCCVWEKTPNTHKNCDIIKQLILENL